MTRPDLSQFTIEALQDEIDRRQQEAIAARTEKLRRLSAFVKQHQEEMALLFELGGCSRPEECVKSLIVVDYYQPEWVPVAYTRKIDDDHPE